MPYLNVNGRHVEYTEYHLRTGPVPLFLLASDRDFWNPVAKLMPWDYYVIAPVWSGDVGAAATDTLGFLQAMKMPWAHLVGYGDGAQAALLAAHRAPQSVRSITALAPFANGTKLSDALPWQRLSEIQTPTLLLEPDQSSAEERTVFDRLLEALPNGRPETVRDWQTKLSDDLARRLATTIVHQVETAYDGISPFGVSSLRTGE